MHIRLARALTTLITSAAVQRLSPLLAAPQPPLRPPATGDAPPPPRPLRIVAAPPMIPAPSPAPDDGGAHGWPTDGTVEAIRVGNEVLLREPRAPWPALSASLRRAGAQVHRTLSVVAAANGPAQPDRVPWTEVHGSIDWTGSWSISGSVPSLGGAIGWGRTYRLHADGTYVLTEYPPRSSTGRWQVSHDRAHVILDGATTVVALARPPTARRALGPLTRTHVRILMEPGSSPHPIPWIPVDAETDEAGQVTITVPANIARLHVGAAHIDPLVVRL